MRSFRARAGCVALSVLAGCATVPSYRDDAVSTAEIARHIKCELREAAWSNPSNAWLQPWNAALVLSLEVFHNGELGADSAVVFPVQSGAFVPNLTAGFSGQATRTERISFNESLLALHRDPNLGCKGRETGHYGRLGGQLGIADLFERAGRTRKVANLTGLTQLDYNLDFIIKSNAGLEPRFSLVPIGNSRSVGGGIKLTGSNSDTQTLKLTLVPPAQAPTARGIGTSARGAGPPIAPADEDRLERSKSRNLLESIDDKLRRQNLGN
ncbi:MAG: hypothetical protein EHM67_07745 [Hyphomicrobiaceae bacterium]|nr:MAG: hypothetical protein EHM67_07745 [Hyphomicrobiaceae bacterium]